MYFIFICVIDCVKDREMMIYKLDFFKYIWYSFSKVYFDFYIWFRN